MNKRITENFQPGAKASKRTKSSDSYSSAMLSANAIVGCSFFGSLWSYNKEELVFNENSQGGKIIGSALTSFHLPISLQSQNPIEPK